MKNSNNLSNSQLKEYAENHIRYEYEMLLWSARILGFLAAIESKGHIHWTLLNGLLNTFAIHARNLTLFLYPGDKKDRHPSDVVIENYINQSDLNSIPSISPLLQKVKIKANKQVAHLTTNRIQYELKDKPWNFIQISEEIMRIFSNIVPFIFRDKITEEFRTLLSEEKLGSPLIQIRILENNNKFPIGLEIKIISDVIIKESKK